MQKPPSGFTLIELMITVAVIGILAAIAVPSYRDFVIRGRIPEATTTLAGIRARMEQSYQDNRVYSNAAATASDPCYVAPTANAHFTFACVLANGGQGFLVTATGVTGKMSSFAYTVNHLGDKRTTGLPANWGTPYPACWVTKKGPEC